MGWAEKKPASATRFVMPSPNSKFAKHGLQHTETIYITALLSLVRGWDWAGAGLTHTNTTLEGDFTDFTTIFPLIGRLPTDAPKYAEASPFRIVR